MRRKIIALFIVVVSLSACGDEEQDKQMGKIALTAGGAVGGALLGNHMTSPENSTMGMTVGALAGGALGYFAGDAIMK